MSEEQINIEQLPDYKVTPGENFLNFKIIIIGESGVGKSSILRRAVQNAFEQGYHPTIGFEFLLIHYKVNELKLKLQVWDTCGQEMFRSLVQGFYRNSSLAIIVYDVSERSSYENLELWIKDCRQHTDQEFPIFIVGNKVDLKKDIQTEEAKFFSTSNRATYFTECSAKSGYQCKEMFMEAAKVLYKKYKQLNQSLKKSLNPNRLCIQIEEGKDEPNKKNKCKCQNRS